MCICNKLLLYHAQEHGYLSFREANRADLNSGNRGPLPQAQDSPNLFERNNIELRPILSPGHARATVHGRFIAALWRATVPSYLHESHFAEKKKKKKKRTHSGRCEDDSLSSPPYASFKRVPTLPEFYVALRLSTRDVDPSFWSRKRRDKGSQW